MLRFRIPPRVDPSRRPLSFSGWGGVSARQGWDRSSVVPSGIGDDPGGEERGHDFMIAQENLSKPGMLPCPDHVQKRVEEGKS